MTLDLLAAQLNPEQAVIASLLLDARSLMHAVDEITGDDFADARLGMIYEGVLEMFARREAIDVITVGAHLAGWGVRGITEADLHVWISAVPSSASIGHYARLVRDGSIRRGIRAAGSGLVHASDGVDAAQVLTHAIDSLLRLRESGVRRAVTAKSLGDILLGDDEYDWVVDGLIERGDRVMVTGSEGGGKSTLMRQIAIMASAGMHPFRFTPMKPAEVLVIDAENTEKQWRRESRAMALRAAMHGARNPADVMRLACVRRMDLTRDRDLGMVHKMLDEYEPDLLFIGPLYRLVPRAINNDDDAAPLIAALDTIRDRGVALMIEAHAGHAVGQRGERDMRPRGSAALLGWPEFGFGLRPDKGGRSSNDFELVPWRGSRDATRRWPRRLARGASHWPWTQTDSGDK